MSVLIEDTTVVVKRQYLDSEFPGGVEEFLVRVRMAFSPQFIADDDPTLVRVRLLTSDDAREVATWLCGSPSAPRDALEAIDDNESEDAASVATPLHDELLTVLADSGWRVYSAAAPEAFVDLLGTAAVYTCRYFASEELRVLVCTTRCPVMIPEAARERTMRFITRANFGMFYGAFEMDLDDGMLLFRANLAVRDGRLTTDMVKHMASAGAWSFDRYLPRLMEVVFGKRRVRDAVNEADAS